MDTDIITESQRNAETRFNEKIESIKLVAKSSHHYNVYSQLITSLKEVVNVYEGNCNKEDVELILNFSQTKVGEMKSRVNNAINEKNNDNTVREFVNCNVVCSKKRKTHGVKY